MINIVRAIARLQSETKELRAIVDAPDAHASPELGPPSGAEAVALRSGQRVDKITWLWAAPIASLLLAHYFISVKLNLPPSFLYCASFLIPIPFGSLAIWRSQRSISFWSGLFLIVSIAAVIGMNIVTAAATRQWELVDNKADVKDNVFAILSICLSFTAAMLATATYIRLVLPADPRNRVLRADLDAATRRLRVLFSASSVDSINKYATLVGTLITAVGALYFALLRL